MMATLGSLPNEIRIAIAGHLTDFQDLAALALTDRRFFSAANPGLYATAARNYKPALFYCAENGLIGPMNSLLINGADPNQTFCSPITRESLNRALAAQGRGPGKRPLVDRKLVLEIIASDLRRVNKGAVVNSEECELQLPSYMDLRDHQSLFPQLKTLSGEFDIHIDADPLGPQHPHYLWTSLHVAAQRGDDALVTLLLDNSAAIDSALHAVDDFVSRNLLPRTYGPATGEPLWHFATPLYVAISAGHKSTARLLLVRGASTVVSSGGITALHLAAWHGDLELCRSLLDENPRQEVDSRTGAELTSFHYAVAGGHLQTVGRFLLERGADTKAEFEGNLLDGYRDQGSEVKCADAFTLALWTHKYSDALVLLEMNPDFAETAHDTPWLSSMMGLLIALPSERSGDSEELVSVLRHLLLRSQGYTEHVFGSFQTYYTSGVSRDLPQFLNAMLEDAEAQALSLPSIEPWISRAMKSVRSSAAVDAVMALIQYGVSKQRMPMPRLSCMFPPASEMVWMTFSEETLRAGCEARLEIAKLVYQRLSADPKGVSDSDLHAALLNACQAGGLKICEWLASLGALRLVDTNDLVLMLNQAANMEDYLLTDWVLTQAENAGDKPSVLNGICLGQMISRSRGNETALVLARHGANLDVALHDERPQRAGATYALFSCQTRQRMTLQDPYSKEYNINVFFMVCCRPDIAGAAEICHLAIRAAREGAKKLVNCIFLVSHSGETVLPISLLCSMDSLLRGGLGPRRHIRWDVDDEPARLSMLQMVLDAGAAEVHTLAEVLNCGEAEDHEEPSELLWHALASEDTHEIDRQQTLTSGSNGSPVWRVHNLPNDPIRCAIRNGFPKLVQAILEARPLPTRNHPAALRYLEAACGEGGRVCPRGRLLPQILSIVLTMANLDHADLLHPNGETALLMLLKYYRRDRIGRIHRCLCEPELLGPEIEDLSNMVRLLLIHGAKWKTRCPGSGTSAIDELRNLMSRERDNGNVYEEHNLARLRKHIVLDLNSVAACTPDNFMDFNPFEMGEIKATTGSG